MMIHPPENATKRKTLQINFPCLARHAVTNELFMFQADDISINLGTNTTFFRSTYNIKDFIILDNKEIVKLSNNNREICEDDDDDDDKWLD